MNNLDAHQTRCFQDALSGWFRVKRRDLPWRRTGDPYRIWVSEVMLQQTQVATVIPYYERFVGKYPDILTMANAPIDDILKSWEKLGYYARARNFHKAACEVVAEYGGDIPDDPQLFRKLPGVGEYIAAAVLSIAFGKPLAVVDGNVKRVLARVFLVESPVNAASTARVFKELAAGLLDTNQPGDFNQAMMELGALVCTPRSPECGVCPVREHCRAFASERQADFPVRQKKQKTPRYHIAVGIVRDKDRILITRRKESGLLGGLWEFPGGKVQPGESAEDACRRELLEEVNVEVIVGELITHVNHAYSHFKISVDVFECEYKAGEIHLNGAVDYKWILAEDTAKYAFPAANHKIFPYLKRMDSEE
jgi:A/G-specific adenine glycosylase